MIRALIFLSGIVGLGIVCLAVAGIARTWADRRERRLGRWASEDRIRAFQERASLEDLQRVRDCLNAEIYRRDEAPETAERIPPQAPGGAGTPGSPLAPPPQRNPLDVP